MARSNISQNKAITGSEKEQPLSLKDKLLIKKEARQKKQKLTGLIIFCLAFSVLVGLPVALLSGPKFGIMLSAAILISVLSFNYPRTALWVFLIYLPLNGTVIYWFGSGNVILQLSKDAFYIPALIALFLECRRKQLPIIIPKQILPTLGLLVAYCTLCFLVVNVSRQFMPTCASVEGLQVFRDGMLKNVLCRDNEPVLQGLLGLKILVGYIPLMFCAYYLINDRQKLLILGRVLVTLAIICCVLGLIQYWLLKTGRCAGTRGFVGDALFRATLEAKCFVGGALIYSPEVGQIRLPGTFVSPWHWAWFLLSNTVICYASAFSEVSKKWRFAAIVGLALIAINALVCGQRLAFFAVPMILVLLLVITGQIANLKKFIPVALGLVLVMGIGFSAINPDFISQRIDSAVGRWNQSPPYAFILDQLDFARRTQRGILGRGLGTGTASARVFGDIAFIESFHSKLLYELGYGGLAIYMIFITHLVYLAFKAYRGLKDPVLKGFASSYWVMLFFVAFNPYWYALDTDPVGVYYWFFAGVIFKLSTIEYQDSVEELQKEGEVISKRKAFNLKRKSTSWS